MLVSSCSDDLVVHGSVTVGGSSIAAVLVWLSAGIEVVRHLGIKLLGGLLGRAGVAGLLAATPRTSAGGLRGGLLLLVGRRLGLGLGLADALGQGLCRRSHLGSLGTTNDNLDLEYVSRLKTLRDEDAVLP